MTKPGVFDAATRETILDSTNGQCARCQHPADQTHHRRPRGMGGTSNRAVGQPCNGIPLCLDCHTWVERNRAEARTLGWLLSDIGDATTRAWWSRPALGWLLWTFDDGAWSTVRANPPLMQETEQ